MHALCVVARERWDNVLVDVGFDSFCVDSCDNFPPPNTRKYAAQSCASFREPKRAILEL